MQIFRNMLEELKKHNAIAQERIMKSFGYADTEDFIQKGEDEIELIQKGEIDYDFELEKAVYADTSENRKLGRVGQEYHRGKGKKKDAGSSNGVNKAHEQEKRDRIKGIRYNGAGVDTDIFIDNNKTDYYKSIMKKYGVSDVGELADKLGEKDGGYDKYEKIYMKMLREIPAAAFYKERRG